MSKPKRACSESEAPARKNCEKLVRVRHPNGANHGTDYSENLFLLLGKIYLLCPAMTPEEQANLDNLQRAHDMLLEGYCGMSVAYMASQLLELRRTVEKQAATIRELRSDSLKMAQRLDNAGRNFANLERAFRSLEKTVDQPCTANSK